MLFREDLETLVPYAAGQSRPGAVKLSSNENPRGPSPRALQALQGQVRGLHRYPDAQAWELRQAIARHHGVDPEQVVTGNGSDEVLTLIAGCVIRPGVNAVTAANTFSEYTFAARLFGAHVRKAPLKEGRFDLEALLALSDTATRVFFICNPNNPTGTYVSHADLERFLHRAPSEALVVVDEAYADYATAPDFPRSLELLARHERLVILRTFSKLYGLAGLRVGYALCWPEVARWLQRVRQPFNNGTLAQVGAVAALEDRSWVEETLALHRQELARLERFLGDRRVCYYPTQANFVCFHTGGDARDLSLRLLEEGVAIRPLNSFGLSDWARVTVGTADQMDRFYEAYDRLTWEADVGGA